MAAPDTPPFPLILLDCHMPEMDGFMVAERLATQPASLDATIMMLSSGGERGDSTRCRALGIKAYLMKPLSRSDLLRAIVTTLSVPGNNTGPDSLVTRHSMRESRAPLRVLLAEDNVVNQRVAVRLLEKEGHVVTVVANGRAAVDAWVARPPADAFDVVLMDVQMLVMDGFQATAAIRAEEQRLGRRATIIAMTAHAMQGDRERCLAAGMDGYLSKPIVLVDLLAALVLHAPQAVARPVAPPAVASNAGTVSGPSWDQNLARAQLGGDDELVLEIAHTLLAALARQLTQLQDAITGGDPERVANAAHNLKGAVSAVAAMGAFEASSRLEESARAGDVSALAGKWGTLKVEMHRLLADLRTFVDARAVPAGPASSARKRAERLQDVAGDGIADPYSTKSQ